MERPQFVQALVTSQFEFCEQERKQVLVVSFQVVLGQVDQMKELVILQEDLVLDRRGLSMEEGLQKDLLRKVDCVA